MNSVIISKLQYQYLVRSGEYYYAVLDVTLFEYEIRTAAALRFRNTYVIYSTLNNGYNYLSMLEL